MHGRTNTENGYPRLHDRMLRVAATIGVAMMSAIFAQPATAVECDDDLTTNTSLTEDLFCCEDIACDGEGPLDLSSGADLDLDGYNIRCMCDRNFCSITRDLDCVTNTDCTGGSNLCVDATCSDCDYAAVTMSGGSSTVKNLGSTESAILGNFLIAVDCNVNTGSQVFGIRVEIGGENTGPPNGFHFAIADCAKVKENVLIQTEPGTSGRAITTETVANSDYIRDNYMVGWELGIVAGGSKGIEIDHNFIYMETDVGTRGIFVGGNTSSTLDVNNNVIMGIGDADHVPFELLGAGTNGTVEDNLCDPENVSCADCIDDGFCFDPTAPFALP